MQRQNMTTLFVSDDSDSFFVELLAKYLFLDKHFKLQIVKVEESILRAGKSELTRHRPAGANLRRRLRQVPVSEGDRQEADLIVQPWRVADGR